MKIEQI